MLSSDFHCTPRVRTTGSNYHQRVQQGCLHWASFSILNRHFNPLGILNISSFTAFFFFFFFALFSFQMTYLYISSIGLYPGPFFTVFNSFHLYFSISSIYRFHSFLRLPRLLRPSGRTEGIFHIINTHHLSLCLLVENT